MPNAQVRLVGTEQEPAVCVVPNRTGPGLNPNPRILIQQIIAGVPHLSFADSRGGFVLPSGSVVSIDGDQPELMTAECTTIRSLVETHCGLRDWFAQRLANLSRMLHDYSGAEISYGAACYSTKTTYGTHVNIDSRTRESKVSQILPHLFVILLPLIGSGALVFGTTTPCWMAHVEVRNLASLFKFKHGFRRGYSRLQIATSTGSNRSQWSLALGFGCLKLAVEAIDRGIIDNSFPRFENILHAAIEVNRDYSLRKRHETSRGSQSTLELLEQLQNRFWKVSDSGDLLDSCKRMQWAIEQLRLGPHALATTHDPCILYQLLQALGNSEQTSGEEATANQLEFDLNLSRNLSFPQAPTRRRRSLPLALIRSTLSKSNATPAPASQPKERLLTLAEELYTRWSILGSGIFDELDEAALLTHRVPGWTLGDETQLTPPTSPVRAAERGHFVLKHSSQTTTYEVGWDSIVDKSNNLILSIGDPFIRSTKWTPIQSPKEILHSDEYVAIREVVHLYLPSAELESRRQRLRATIGTANAAITSFDTDYPDDDPRSDRYVPPCSSAMSDSPPPSDVMQQIQLAYKAYKKSHYSLARRHLERIFIYIEDLPPNAAREWRRFSAFTSARLGTPIGDNFGEEHLREQFLHSRIDAMSCSDMLCVRRYTGLRPKLDRDTRNWFEKGTQLVRPGDSSIEALYGLYWGNIQLANGNLEDARQSIEYGLVHEVTGLTEVRVLSLLLCGLAEIDRIQGQLERARHVLGAVRTAQESLQLWGDLADFTLPGIAKTTVNQEARSAILSEAVQLARQHHHHKAAAKAILIDARTTPNEARADALRRELHQEYRRVPDLWSCTFTRKVIADWHSWCGAPAGPSTDYQGL